MSGKSRHSKRKHSTLSKRVKQRQHSLATTAQQSVTVPASMLATPANKTEPRKSIPTLSGTPANQYAYVAAELKKIGILTGIILVILIVLALILR
jgi:hypothetical protein